MQDERVLLEPGEGLQFRPDEIHRPLAFSDPALHGPRGQAPLAALVEALRHPSQAERRRGHSQGQVLPGRPAQVRVVQSRQAWPEGVAHHQVRLEVGFIPGEQVAAVAGFGILQRRQAITRLEQFPIGLLPDDGGHLDLAVGPQQQPEAQKDKQDHEGETGPELDMGFHEFSAFWRGGEPGWSNPMPITRPAGPCTQHGPLRTISTRIKKGWYFSFLREPPLASAPPR